MISIYALPTQEARAGSSSSTSTVTIQNFAFSPAEVDITPGMTVVWINNDTTTHTSTSDISGAESWNSGNLASGQSFSRVFMTVGTYTYHCAIHPSMHGTVRVIQSSQSMMNMEATTPVPTTAPAAAAPVSMSMPASSSSFVPLMYNQSQSNTESTEYQSVTNSPLPAPSSYVSPAQLPKTGPPISSLILIGLLPGGLILRKYIIDR